MDVQADKKHSWRTKFTNLKDRLNSRVKGWGKSTLKNLNSEKVQELIDVLESDEDDRFEKAFGGHAHLLEEFARAAEERKKNGEPKRKRNRSPNAKTTLSPPPPEKLDAEEDSPASDDEETEDEEEEPPVRKQPRTTQVASDKNKQEHAAVVNAEACGEQLHDSATSGEQRRAARLHGNFEPRTHEYQHAGASQTQQRQTTMLHGDNFDPRTLAHRRIGASQLQQRQTAATTAAFTGNQFADENLQQHNTQLDQLFWRLGQWN